ncbi:hypothetical protein J40TS1_26230 [Paenibacillus montaniterrae]|uniref:Uncharacterized protein n=1 Tax=Paenibacillus montaniterrae TaxID=429341 RepID=A0A919YRE9_9BACL|nr:hypothetical protein [Paenibacillus montaniterrae]GIP16981.1 hypothetical protein J40TS1_26230 [Paenibacillus montaniterrae]
MNEHDAAREHGARKRYYVDVQGKQLHLQQGVASYHLEIDATDEEAELIEAQFRKLDERDESSLNRMMRYNLTQGEQVAYMNDEHDEEMQTLFRLLHQCGTDETKRHIEGMNVLY